MQTVINEPPLPCECKLQNTVGKKSTKNQQLREKIAALKGVADKVLVIVRDLEVSDESEYSVP
jgi:hypothetical protein